jgi:hypothetical protein
VFQLKEKFCHQGFESRCMQFFSNVSYLQLSHNREEILDDDQVCFKIGDCLENIMDYEKLLEYWQFTDNSQL